MSRATESSLRARVWTGVGPICTLHWLCVLELVLNLEHILLYSYIKMKILIVDMSQDG